MNKFMCCTGMNELLAPLYWLCRGDSAGGGAEHAEADSWHLFVALVSDFRDNFCKQLDNTQMGIKATLGRLSDMLKQHDRELWYHLAVINKVRHSAGNASLPRSVRIARCVFFDW